MVVVVVEEEEEEVGEEERSIKSVAGICMTKNEGGMEEEGEEEGGEGEWTATDGVDCCPCAAPAGG